MHVYLHLYTAFNHEQTIIAHDITIIAIDNTYKIKHVEIKSLTKSVCVNWRLVKKEVIDGTPTGILDVQQ